eukprot:588392-Hanusia_phi.AAC.1
MSCEVLCSVLRSLRSHAHPPALTRGPGAASPPAFPRRSWAGRKLRWELICHQPARVLRGREGGRSDKVGVRKHGCFHPTSISAPGKQARRASLTADT